MGEVIRFEGKYILRVTTEETLANQTPRCWERAYLRDGVIIIPITREGKIRFVREQVWTDPHAKTKLVTGYMDDGELPLDAARRELQEELGLTAEKWTPLVSYGTKGAVNKMRHYFVARGLTQGEASPEESENILGPIDMSFAEVHDLALHGGFGYSETACVLLCLTDKKSPLWSWR